MPRALSCFTCGKIETGESPMKRCARCRNRFYCGTVCQTADWQTHKRACGDAVPTTSGAATAKWYDKHRKCQDGSVHEGNLELITWVCEKEGTGWGHCLLDESDDLRAKFENEFHGDEKKLYKYFPQAFRWTCCGTDAGMKWGCDHHGTGKEPCTCDFCKMGKPLPDKIYNDADAARHGLRLSRGPDPRSFSMGAAARAISGRSMLGLDM